MTCKEPHCFVLCHGTVRRCFPHWREWTAKKVEEHAAVDMARYELKKAREARAAAKRAHIARERLCACGEPRRRNQATCADCYVPHPGMGRKKAEMSDAVMERLGLLNVKRCRCGLILPCGDCTVSIQEVASWRPGSASGWAL